MRLRIPFRRGNDGLTDRQRAKYARRYMRTIGKTPTPSELRTVRLMAAAANVQPVKWQRPRQEGEQ